jgi:hypothetical protein
MMPIVSPQDFGAVGFGSTGLSQMPTVIHGSVFPLLIAGSWFALSTAGGTVRVFETIRQRG